MVAELLRLRARLLLNALRRPPGVVFGMVVVFLVVIAIVLASWAVGPFLQQQDDDWVLRMIVTIGSLGSVCAFLIPVLFVRSESLHPRAFQGYRIPTIGIVATLLMFAVLGPLLVLLPLAYAPTAAWPDAESRSIAMVAAPLIFLVALFSALLGRELGVLLRHHPHTSRLVRVLGVTLIVAWLGVAFVIACQRIPALLDVVRVTGAASIFRRVPAALAESPIGMLWAAPWHASSSAERPSAAWTLIWSGVALVVFLFIIWIAIVLTQLRPTRRLAITRRWVSTGWFGRLPSSPIGAVAARSFSYWFRDPRYRSVLAILPVLPVVILTAFAIGGVPFQFGVLVPLPVLVLVLAWSTMHNDVAYDSTAIWSHLAAGTRGTHDRIGRLVPVLVFGTVLIAIGVPLTAWGYGGFGIVPALLGLCLALLLGGVGVSSMISARFPYPAPRPGDPAFQQPQVAGSQGGATQGFSILLVLLVATPALISTVIWVEVGSSWSWIALVVGGAAGLLVFVLGTRGGARSFDRRGPELLAFTMRN